MDWLITQAERAALWEEGREQRLECDERDLAAWLEA